jgi:hypothetical protein
MAVNLPLTPEQQSLALEEQQSKQVIEKLKLFRDKTDTTPFLIPNLISLNLKDKQLRPEEMKWLAESLKLHPTLQKLDLSSAVRPDGERGKVTLPLLLFPFSFFLSPSPSSALLLPSLPFTSFEPPNRFKKKKKGKEKGKRSKQSHRELESIRSGLQQFQG